MPVKRTFPLSILLIMMVLALPVAAEVEPPPEPAQISQKERNSVIALYEAMSEDKQPLQVGDPESAVIGRMGAPDGIMSIGSRKRMSYGDGTIIISDGKIVEINDIAEAWLAAPSREAYEDYQRALGNVFYMGKWMTVDESKELYERTLSAQRLTGQRITRGRIEQAKRKQQYARKQAPILDYRQNGQRISRQELVVQGKVTVVDFYADWCGPCKQIAPYLQKLATDPEVAVRKVDIVKWGSPVAQQWKLKSIPNMRVYDRQGQPVGEPTHDFRQVMRLINSAKRQ